MRLMFIQTWDEHGASCANHNFDGIDIDAKLFFLKIDWNWSESTIHVLLWLISGEFQRSSTVVLFRVQLANIINFPIFVPLPIILLNSSLRIHDKSPISTSKISSSLIKWSNEPQKLVQVAAQYDSAQCGMKLERRIIVPWSTSESITVGARQRENFSPSSPKCILSTWSWRRSSSSSSWHFLSSCSSISSVPLPLLVHMYFQCIFFQFKVSQHPSIRRCHGVHWQLPGHSSWDCWASPSFGRFPVYISPT